MALARDYSHYVKELDAGIDHLDLAVEGVSCAGCMAKIERGLSAMPAVTRARVNLTDRRLAVEWRKGAVDPAALIDRLAELGYKAYPFEPVRAELSRPSSRASCCAALACGLCRHERDDAVDPGVVGQRLGHAARAARFFPLAVALIVLPAATYAGQPFFQSAWRALKAGGVNMDVPISIGVILALGMSVVETMQHAEHAYFDAAVMLLTFLLADAISTRTCGGGPGRSPAISRAEGGDGGKVRRDPTRSAKCRPRASAPATSCCCGRASARLSMAR